MEILKEINIFKMVKFSAMFIIIVAIYLYGNSNDDGYETNVPTIVETIKVHVQGAVVSEGVYSIDPQMRLEELIDLAGGFDNANLSCVNLVEQFIDGEKIIIPNSDEYCTSSGRININKATTKELEKLVGIGPSKALAITDYIKSNGKFNSIEGLMVVTGIGEKTFEKIKGDITIK